MSVIEAKENTRQFAKPTYHTEEVISEVHNSGISDLEYTTNATSRSASRHTRQPALKLSAKVSVEKGRHIRQLELRFVAAAEKRRGCKKELEKSGPYINPRARTASDQHQTFDETDRRACSADRANAQLRRESRKAIAAEFAFLLLPYGPAGPCTFGGLRWRVGSMAFV